MAKCQLKQRRLAKKSVVHAVLHVAISPRVHVSLVQLVVVVHRVKLTQLRRRLKENKHVATSTQEIPQRAERP
jgi:hypothetical protein